MKNPFKNKTGAEIFIEVLGFIALTAVFIAMSIDAAYATNNRDNNEQEQEQEQTQDQNQAQEANASASASASNDGNSQSINFNSTTPDDITIRNTASARPPNFNATAPCYYGWSAGLGVAGANIGGGKNKLDAECNLRETARTMAGLGEVEQAIKILCATEAAKEALGDKCGLSTSNVYLRVNEPVRYVERASEATHDVSEEAVKACSEGTTRAFEHCQMEGDK